MDCFGDGLGLATGALGCLDLEPLEKDQFDGVYDPIERIEHLPYGALSAPSQGLHKC